MSEQLPEALQITSRTENGGGEGSSQTMEGMSALGVINTSLPEETTALHC